MPSPEPPSPVGADDIGTASLNLIVIEEDGNPAYYAAHYTHFDCPGGQSGPTLGVGYDCGYSSTAKAIADWKGFIDDPQMLTAIGQACGRRGPAAQAWVAANRNRVTVPFDVGLAQFRAVEIPQWVSQVRAALPNYDSLPPDCRGVLVSIAYNRGCSFNQPGQRDLEMRNIREAMISKDFAAIPAQILSMRRLWPRGGDLWNRREHEAVLFQKSLAAPS